MGKITILPQTTKDPLQLIGTTAAICYDADISNKEKNIKRALNCIRSDHGRVLEWPNVEVIIEGYSAKMMREAMRHIVGTSVLQASTRYIDYEKGFGIVIPPSVSCNKDALETWNTAIDDIKAAMAKLKEIGVPKEDYTNLLPLAYESKMVWKVNLRTLVHFMNVRLCSRAYWEIRDFAKDLKLKLESYSDEWKIISDNLFVPKCEKVGYCIEEKCCGRKPK